jgi:predicted RNase H-like nuclease
VTVVAGVDACRGGWIAIVLEDGRFADALFASGFVRLLDGLARAAAVGVDIPIGLPEEGQRAADLAARAFVGPRRGSVPACLSRDANRQTRRGGAAQLSVQPASRTRRLPCVMRNSA